MEHSISPKITDSYDPKAENIYTLKDWHENKANNIVTGYLIAYQIVIPIFVLVSSYLAILYFLYAKPHSFEERINTLAEKEFEMRANLYIITSMSIMFSAYALIMSAIACAEGTTVLDEFKNWFNNDRDSEKHFEELYHISTTILVENIIFPIILITGVGAYCGCKKCYNKEGEEKNFWEVHVFFLLLPITSVAVHGNHILIGFIHTPYHATGIGTLYGIIIITCIAILKIFNHLLSLLCRCIKSYRNKKYENMDKDQNEFHWVECFLPFISMFVITVTVLFFAFIIAIYFLLPINIAIDEAPNRLTTIYHGLVVIFAGFITYWIVIKQNKSPLSSFIRAKEKKNKKDNCKEWENKTYQEKEEEVANIILKHYGDVK